MAMSLICCLFFFNDTATTEIYTLSLHDALPIWYPVGQPSHPQSTRQAGRQHQRRDLRRGALGVADRKSTRLNSSHSQISYAVFCLKKKMTTSVGGCTRDASGASTIDGIQAWPAR